MTSSTSTLSSEEQEQILQTIEMFEVIIQASPQDCQSMEILKDAYLKIGKQAEALAISRKVADTYVELGQYSLAMLEYENILQKDPGNPAIIAALGEVEERMKKSGQKVPAINMGSLAPPSDMLNSAFDLAPETFNGGAGTLITTNQTQRSGGEGERQRGGSGNFSFSDDGNEPLAKFLIQHKLVPEEVVASALDRVKKKNADRAANTIPLSLIDEICRRGAVDQETLLSGILDRSKFAYIPLEYYDVDRAVMRMIPEELTVGRLIVPFDVMSRTLMIAMANPFDAAAKEAVQQLLDYNIQWHLASPSAIIKILAEAYKIGAAPESINFRLAS